MMKKLMRWVLTGIGILLALLVVLIIGSAVAYSPEYVLRVLRMGESDVEDYLYNFPMRPLEASPQPLMFAQALDEAMVAERFQAIFEVPDFETFLEETHTQAFIVIKDNAVLYEGYFTGTDRETLATSYSMAKSYTSALIGIAIGEGYITGVDEPITTYLPELADRDERFNDITIRHLLLMASGLEYRAMRPFLFNGDDPLSTYYPDQRKAALEFPDIIDPPEQYFLYNKYHPQLLGLILERATGVPVAQYLQEKIWTPAGMEFGGSWSLDSEWSGFEKMETGVNAHPIDFARFGQLFLNNGAANGVQLIPAEWVAESTGVDPAHQTEAYYSQDFGPLVYQDGAGYYAYMWYGLLREDGGYDFFAEGDHGQSIYVSPQAGLVVVRNGFEYGIPAFDWTDAFYEFASEMR